MNWVDVGILVFVALTTFAGFMVGLIKAVLSLVGLIVGVILAGRFYAPLAELLSFIKQESLAQAVAFAIILVAVLVAAVVLAWVLIRALSAINLGWINRVGGAVLGLFLGLLLCSAVLAMVVSFAGGSESVSQSALAPFLLDRFPMVLAFLPGEFDSVRSMFR